MQQRNSRESHRLDGEEEYRLTPLFQKMNLGDRTSILVLNAPDSFQTELSKLGNIQISSKATAKTRVSFSIAFVVTQAERDSASKKLVQSAEGDAIVWIAYPKGTSKKYKCEFNRDSGWDVLGDAGFEPVRMVAIDEDWSALRFRRTEHIKTLTRQSGTAISKEGKRRTKKS